MQSQKKSIVKSQPLFTVSKKTSLSAKRIRSATPYSTQLYPPHDNIKKKFEYAFTDIKAKQQDTLMNRILS